MKQYRDLVTKILADGVTKDDRTGTGTKSIFGYQTRFDLNAGFPILTTKRVFWKGVVEELLWMLRGETNVKPLQERGVTIWDEWADKDGDLGPVYGAQWRSWPSYRHTEGGGLSDQKPGETCICAAQGAFDDVVYQRPIDQIRNVIDEIKRNPDSRRLIVSAWNPAQVDDMKLPPCHMLFQFYTRPMTLTQKMNWVAKSRALKEDHLTSDTDYQKLGRDDRERISWASTVADFEESENKTTPDRYLDLQLYQRSSDVFLGVPFNWASYALLTHIIARETGLLPGEFIWSSGDTHIYANHIEQVKLQLERDPRPLPRLTMSKRPWTFETATFDDFALVGYDPHPPIKGDVAV